MFCLVGLEAGLEGMTQYQWSQDGLTVEAGTFTDPTVTGTELDPTVVGTGLSPNDGYAIQGSGCVLTSSPSLLFTDRTTVNKKLLRSSSKLPNSLLSMILPSSFPLNRLNLDLFL